MRKIVPFLFLLPFLAGCGSEDPSEIVVDPGFSSYINAYTSGVISSTSTVKIILIESQENVEPGSLANKDLIELDPEVEGQVYWLDQQTLEFRPDKPFPSGKSYAVEFKLGELREVPSEFETMKFGFTVMTQSIFVEFQGLRATDMEDFSKQELFGTLRTSDVADIAALEKCLSASQDGEEMTIEWEHTEGSKSHTFTVKNVVRRDDAGEVILAWDGEPIGSESEGELEVRIPPLGEFTLVQVNTMRSPGVYFSLQFSDPVDSKQDLTGLVHLESGKGLRLDVNNNEIKAYPTDQLTSTETIVIEQAIRNVMGHQLQERYYREVQFNLEKPAIELLGDGVIIPSTGGVSFPFKAVNLKAVHLRVIRVYEKNVPQFLQVNQLSGSRELTRVGRMVADKEIDLISSDPIDYGVWNNFTIDLTEIVQPEAGAIYRVTLSFDRYHSLYPCAESENEPRPTPRSTMNFDDGGDYYYNDYYYYDYDYDYDYSERDDPCTPSFYRYNDCSISANIFSSDLGLIAKEQAGNVYDMVVTDLRTTDPISGVQVEAYNYQNMKIGEGRTNGDGLVRISTEGKPYLMLARQGRQRGYLRVDNGSALSVSLYNVGGSKIKEGVKGFIYGERGVWRPGDTIFLSFMLEDKQNVIPKNHPVVLEFYDPQGKLYDQKITTKGVEGLYSFELATQPDDITGIWRAKVIVGNSEFSRSVKVETVKPNRLRINMDLPEVITSDEVRVRDLNAMWLYGAAGSGLKVRVEMEVDNMKTEFKGFEGFQFDDRSKRFSMDDPIISEATTDSEGNTKLRFDWSTPNDAPGMLKLKYSTKVFETGGDFSQDFVSAKFSPYDTYVGVKMDRGSNWINALNTEEEHAIAIAAVDEKGDPLNKTVEVELYKMNWHWWWEGDGSSELTRYINRRSSDLIMEDEAVVRNGKGMYNLKFPKKGWGKYLIRVIDPSSGHSASQIFYAEYPGWYRNDNDGAEAAAMLSLETGKQEYKVGEEVTVDVPSGGIGNLYVTIEKGDKILQQFWVKAASNSTRISFKAEEEMSPNVYVHAVLLQPHAQKENSLPIRMYGVIPVKVVDPNTRLTPVIKAPESLQPESEFTVEVSEKDGKNMAYTLAVVDEGLLGLTRYKTPDPWNTFYSKEALSIRTWDMYKYVMEAQTGKMASLLAVGGDENLVYKEDTKANRFKPVVKYIGPFYLKRGSNKHTLKLPNYIGAVRIMVVAGYEGAYGKAEKEVQVKQPLMVLSTLPRVLGPSERVRIPINVITMNDKIKNVNVKVTSNDLLLPLESQSKTVSFQKQGEHTVYFEYEVARKLGIAKFKVEVSSGSESAVEETELLVRPPNPEISKVETKVVQGGESVAIDYEAFGITGTNEAVLQVSTLPEINIEKHLKYLMSYPHGCIEQTTSAAFPQLFLGSVIELSAQQKEQVRENVVAGINRLRSFQMSSGAFSYWPGSYRIPSEWGTNYAGHFMIEAEKAGYDLPAGLKVQWLKFQKQQAAEWSRGRYDEYGRYGGDLMQSYRLFTLALAGEADIGAMNRLRNDPVLSNVGAWRLSAAYALIGRDDIARELSQRSVEVPRYREMGWSYGSTLRDEAMILETLAYLEEYERGVDLIQDIAKGLSTGWHSTQTRAFGLLAISKYTKASDASRTMKFTLNVNGNEQNINSNTTFSTTELKQNDVASGTLKVTNRSDQLLFVSLVQSGIPIESNDIKVRDDMKLSIEYMDMQGEALDVTTLPQGIDFKARVTVTHPGVRSGYEEIALSQIFPSGWQIVNARLNDDDAATDKSFEYQDIRDDRVYTYFDLGRSNTKVFEVKLNATFSGSFYQPSVLCAPMYDESIKAIEPGRWIKVEEKEGGA